MKKQIIITVIISLLTAIAGLFAGWYLPKPDFLAATDIGIYDFLGYAKNVPQALNDYSKVNIYIEKGGVKYLSNPYKCPSGYSDASGASKAYSLYPTLTGSSYTYYLLSSNGKGIDDSTASSTVTGPFYEPISYINYQFLGMGSSFKIVVSPTLIQAKGFIYEQSVTTRNAYRKTDGSPTIVGKYDDYINAPIDNGPARNVTYDICVKNGTGSTGSGGSGSGNTGGTE